MGLNFTIVNSSSQEVELIQNGKNISVDNNNKLKYIYLVAKFKLNDEIKIQCNEFLKGLQRVIPAEWL